MSTNATYTFVGVSRKNGELAVRYTNDKNRARVLAANGHSEIMFIALPQAERQEDCIDALMTHIERKELVDAELMTVVQAEAERLGFVF